MQQAYLVLENGQVFCGKRFGATGDTVGELVFTTAMTGYLETLTDPSFYGQMVIQTFPLIGNYGVIPQDFESAKPHLKAYIVRQWCQHPSNFRCQGTLDTFLMENGVVGLCDIDTRALTRLVRESGVMNAKICGSIDNLSAILEELKGYRVRQAVESVTCQKAWEAGEGGKYRVVLWDFGAKANIGRELVARGCHVIHVPAHTTAKEVLALKPDGIMLSNGPGDPADNPEIIREVGSAMDSGVPMFGICLGHQLMALSQGAKTEKLKYGHRGANQPAKDTATGRVYITSQNHGYTVIPETLPEGCHMSFCQANDNTCEGVDYDTRPAFSVQFHPEAAAGPLDSAWLFDRFIAMMEGGNTHAAE
nr:carbamoyl phosphate synthase small subunit [bacterium]